MDALSSFLKRFQKIIGDKTEDRRLVQEGIRTVCNIDADIKNIQIRENVAILSLRPLLRAEVFLKKKDVLSFLKDRGSVVIDFQ